MRNDAGRELFPYLKSKNETRQCDDVEEFSHLLEFLANANFPKPTGERIAIIGSGPAGLTAGHDLALMGFRPTIFEMEPQPAGMLYTGVPISVKGEQKPVIIVDETRVDFVLYVIVLAAELGTHVSHLDRLTVLILAFIGNFVGLGFPLPSAREFKESGDFPIPGVADGLDLIPGIDSESLGHFFKKW
ncbi:MAG: NAD(P)-binding protein [Candidatus Sulfotelmatobacter sp.]